VCSAYKFFGPHVGILWGKRRLLEELPAYKVRPVPDQLPDRWMTGTQNHEGLAGVTAAVDYLADLGARQATGNARPAALSGRRLNLRQALLAIQAYEAELVGPLLEGLRERPHFKVWGITDRNRLTSRVPTVSITTTDRPACKLAEHLAAKQIYTWSGNMYALELTERLGLEEQGGLLRMGLLHYNTADEVQRLLRGLDEDV
jgi:selenocysteine lyase/cysteine desulfurase